MITAMQIMLGVLIGSVGFLGIASSPFLGVSALFLGGSLILTGIDHLW
jgi:hypothetical protein